MNQKNHGRLVKVSHDVVELSKITEHTIWHFQAVDLSNVNEITLMFMKKIHLNKYFKNVSLHIFDHEPLSNHLITLTHKNNFKYLL